MKWKIHGREKYTSFSSITNLIKILLKIKFRMQVLFPEGTINVDYLYTSGAFVFRFLHNIYGA